MSLLASSPVYPQVSKSSSMRSSKRGSFRKAKAFPLLLLGHGKGRNLGRILRLVSLSHFNELSQILLDDFHLLGQDGATSLREQHPPTVE